MGLVHAWQLAFAYWFAIGTHAHQPYWGGAALASSIKLSPTPQADQPPPTIPNSCPQPLKPNYEREAALAAQAAAEAQRAAAHAAAAQQQRVTSSYDDYDDGPSDELSRQREDLMDTILEEEEQLITAHRLQVRLCVGVCEARRFLQGRRGSGRGQAV